MNNRLLVLKDFLLICPLLDSYKKLIDKVENYLQTYGEDGFSKAIEDCIKDGVLVEYLKRKIKEIAGINRSLVLSLNLKRNPHF